MQYQESLDYIYSFLDSERRLPQLPAEFNLPRTEALLAALGNPQLRYPSVVIAGTKGKGSTAVMLEAMLHAGGRHIGLFTSPHLHSYRERIQIDRELITQDEFAAGVERLLPVIEGLAPELGHPTTFELGTLVALQHFADQAVDLAVLEIGLGGRFDSVNAVTPLVSAITALSLDHTRTLGNTLAEIAYQKAGIIKPGVPVVSAPQPAAALAVLAQVAAEQGAALYLADASSLWRHASAERRDYPFAPVAELLSLKGGVQLENARVALGVVMLLADAGMATSPGAMAFGLASTWWPGRLEVAGREPLIVLDGAHNGDSAAKLVAALRDNFHYQRLILVLGVSLDKDVEAILRELAPASAAVVLARSRHPRAFSDLERLAQLVAPYQPGHITLGGDVVQALAQARSLATADDLICVTGSLFVVADAREALGLSYVRD